MANGLRREWVGIAQSASVSAQRVKRAFGYGVERSRTVEDRAIATEQELSVEFEKVSFSYSPDTPVLREVSFILEAE